MTWTPPVEFKRDLYERYGLTCPPRWGTPRHPELPTFGPAVGRVMTELGQPPMPWQRYMLDVSLEINPKKTTRVKNEKGQSILQPVFYHREVGLSVMRQQGKTVIVLGVSAFRMMKWARQMVTYAAQNRIMARKKWEDDFVETILASKLKNRFRLRKTNAMEALICRSTHSMMGITSNTEKAGHGDVLDMGIIDEAFSHEDDRMEQAFGPAMITRPLAQRWWCSAGGTERSYYLNRKRDVGRQLIQDYWAHGKKTNVFYAEWYPDDDDPHDSFNTWLGCQPALCPDEICRCDPKGVWHHTITRDVIQTELETMDEPEFNRAYLNRTRRLTPPPDVNIPTKEWPKLANKSSRRGEKLAFALDITPQRDHASISVYSRRGDGIGHGELVAHRPGVDWVVAVLRRLKEKWDPVAIGLDAVTGSPTVAIKDALLKARDEFTGEFAFTLPEDPEKPLPGQLWIPTLQELVAGCGQIVDEIRQGKLQHPDQVPMNVAVGGARTRPLGDAWALARKNAQVNISPFVSLMLARAAYLARVDKIVEDDSEPSVFFLSPDKPSTPTGLLRPGRKLGQLR